MSIYRCSTTFINTKTETIINNTNRVAEKWNKSPENIEGAGNLKTFKSFHDKIPEQQESETYE